MTRGYLSGDQIDPRLFQDGYFRTGDLGRLDTEGRLYLLGRKKLVIDVAGHKVSPVEVEDVLSEHDAVKEAVVIGVDNGASKMIQAYVVAAAPCPEAALISFCRKKLAPFKAPQKVVFISQLPRNNLGKKLRSQGAMDRYVIEETAGTDRPVAI